MVLMAASLLNGAIVYQSNFEGYSVGEENFDWVKLGVLVPGETAISNQQAYSGSKSIKMNPVSGHSWIVQGVDASCNTELGIDMRFYLDGAAEGVKIYTYTPTYGGRDVNVLTIKTGYNGWGLYVNQWGSDTFVLTPTQNAWSQLTLKIDQTSQDKYFDLAYNGVMQGRYPRGNDWLPAESRISELRISAGYQSKNLVYVDDVTIASSFAEVPEPATIGLLMLGGLMLRRRK
jgi:hypothetical protein